MPALSLSIDGITIATVNTDKLNVLDVNVHGTLVNEYANLHFAGGFHPEKGEPTYLTWINELPLEIGQIVAVSFLDHALTSQKGKTIEELYPDEDLTNTENFKPFPEVVKEIRVMKKQREMFSFKTVSSQGNVLIGQTSPEEHGFGFSALWNAWQPEHVSVSLHTYTLENLESRTSLNYLTKEKISLGSEVQFVLLP